MIAQHLAGSKVPREKSCPEGSTALSLPACRAQTSRSSLPYGLPPGHLGLTPLHLHRGKWAQEPADLRAPPTQQGWGRLGCCPRGTSFSAFTWV